MAKDNNLLKDEDSNIRYIVGIGASAGGLEAIQKFLSNLPANTNCAFIIVQHLSPDYKSLLCEILTRHTIMPVIQAEEGMVVEKNHIYVIQPRMNMRIQNGKLRLSSLREHELNFPIDVFFKSLAEEVGNKAIAIVLSGTGSDGSQGVVTIKEQGGLVLAQDDTAKFDGMPKNAIRTGVVDAQMTPEMIASEITHMSANSTVQNDLSNVDNIHVDEDLFARLFVILKKSSNVNFSLYKKPTIIRRMACRMMLTRKETLADYIDYLYTNPNEVKILSKEILIGVTSFFRDPEMLDVLKEKSIYKILEQSKEDESIRIWVAGCSTGEEAYSIVMLFLEAMETLNIHRKLKVFATDLDGESIETASKGLYRDSIIDTVSSERLSKFFTLTNGNYTIKHSVRKMIIFSRHNVFQDPPCGKLDLISCRNMLIYFQQVLQNDLFNTFHIALKDKGYLFLGKSESVGTYNLAFPTVDSTAKLYIHNSNVRYPNARKISFLQTSSLENELQYESFGGGQGYEQRRGVVQGANDDPIITKVLEQYLPGCVVVDHNNRIYRTFGECKNYIHIPLGEFTNDLLDIICEGLKIPVSTILNECKESNEKVQYNNITFKGEINQETISLCATSIPSNNEATNYYAILFLSNNNDKVGEEGIPFEIDKVTSKRISDLEKSLSLTHDKLDISVSEQESINEELQAANEELLTANEELQSSNEELQSVNEELYTVNSEYQSKLTELSELNDDITNFLSSRLIGILFVDRKLNIRRYTDYVSTEFAIMPHDISRPIKCITYNFPLLDITEICMNVLETLKQDDREVISNTGKVYNMRTEPYHSTQGAIDGCVITIIEVTYNEQNQPNVNQLNRLDSIINSPKDNTKKGISELFLSNLNDITKCADDFLLDNSDTTNIIELSNNVKELKKLIESINSKSK